MPPSPSVLQFTSLWVQAAGALLTAGVFRAFYRDYQRGALLSWTRAWFALATTALGKILELWLQGGPPSMAAWAPLASLLALVAAYLQVAWLVLGTYELSWGIPVPRRDERRVLSWMGAVGAVSALLAAIDLPAPDVRAFVRIGLLALVSCAAYLTAAYVVWFANGRGRGIGYRLVGGALVAATAEQVHVATLAAGGLFFDARPRYSPYVGFVDLLVHVALALGLLAWMLEDERRATLDAARQAEHLAYHDPLTGLPNRQLFLDRLHLAVAHARRASERVAVLFLDLDRFKQVNDSLGHAAGDLLLRTVAQRVSGVLRQGDTVARIGGDEFVILSPEVGHPDDAVRVARKVLATVDQPIAIDGRDVTVTASVGISLFPDDGADAAALLRHADAAMYHAKSDGRDAFHLYTPGLHARAAERLALEGALRRAVGAGEFVVHYQPIVGLETGRVEGVEALVRWQHPELGLLAPDLFVPVAEASGLIVPLGEWALRTACDEVLAMDRQRPAGAPPLRLNVNVSVRQLQRGDFVQSVRSALADSGFPPERLVLEVTETVAMQHADETAAVLRDLRALGVRLAIDDFGTGFSSLALLRHCPVDALKIDRAFVSDLGNRGGGRGAIAAAVIALAHSLSLSVVAEGVETEDQLEFLRERGCDAWQGFLCSPPIPAGDWPSVLRTAERRPSGESSAVCA